MAIETTASLKAFTITGLDATEQTAFINAVNPLMYNVISNVIHMICDGHAWDEASLDRVGEVINGNGAGTAVTVSEKTATITLA